MKNLPYTVGLKPYAGLLSPLGFLNPVVGFPLGDEDAVGGGYLGLLDEGTELVATELTGETVNELGTAGVGSEVYTTGLKVFEGFAPAGKEHAQNIISHILIYFSASPLDER